MDLQEQRPTSRLKQAPKHTSKSLEPPHSIPSKVMIAAGDREPLEVVDPMSLNMLEKGSRQFNASRVKAIVARNEDN